MTTSKSAEATRDPCVFLRVPQEAWGLLRETLERDSSSCAFDPALRVTIREALEQVEELPCPPENDPSAALRKTAPAMLEGAKPAEKDNGFSERE